MVIIKMKIEQYASIILIVVGFYYIIAELIAIVSSKSGVKAYLYNTISELGTNSFSPQFKLMNSAFFLTGITFGACYALVIYPELTGLYRFICLILASSLSIGTLVVGMFHGGEYLFHNIGTVMTFVGGSLLLIFTALSLEANSSYKIAYFLLGSISVLACIIFSFFKIYGINMWYPILERLIIYPIILFEISTGIQTISKLYT